MKLVHICAFMAVAVAGTACIDSPPPAPKIVAGGNAQRGEKFIATYGCGSCHNVPGVTGARGRVGPPLDFFADRTFFAGALRNEPETLVRWIVAPQSLRPGTAMPTLGVSDAHARDIAAYLYTLHEGGLGAPHLFPQGTLPSH